MKLILVFLIVAASFVAAAERAAAKHSLIVDTDMGPDDLMAIAFLLARDDVAIEAVLISPGLAHVDPGAQNVSRVLELAGRRDVPVFKGRASPLAGNAEFPAPWRKLSDELPGITLPAAVRQPETRVAADYLEARLRERERPVRILALGALTTIAEVVRKSPELGRAVRELVIMGGAVRVPGNLNAGDDFKTDNVTAEWNIFIDPLAADIVFRSGINTLLVPLDATNHVPITAAMTREFLGQPLTLLGRLVAEIFVSIAPFVEQNSYYAWDPLAAVALIERGVVSTSPCVVNVRQQPPEAGRTIESAATGPRIEVAFGADAARFKRVFFEAFQQADERKLGPGRN